MTTDLDPRAVRVLLAFADEVNVNCHKNSCPVYDNCGGAFCDWAKAEAQAWLVEQPKERVADAAFA